jgi:hypothetical protein
LEQIPPPSTRCLEIIGFELPGPMIGRVVGQDSAPRLVSDG